VYLEKRGVPAATIVTTAFLALGRQAAKNLKLVELPLVVTPHPLNDLNLEQVGALADAAYPAVLGQLTSQNPLPGETHVEFTRPASARGTPA
jgi:hypothetical protein